MRDLSEQGLVRAAPEAWRKMHEQPQGWAVTRDGKDSKAIYETLRGLCDDSAAEAADVDLLTDGQLIISPRACKECGARSYGMVEVGGVPLCVTCVHRAMGVLIGVTRA